MGGGGIQVEVRSDEQAESDRNSHQMQRFQNQLKSHFSTLQCSNNKIRINEKKFCSLCFLLAFAQRSARELSRRLWPKPRSDGLDLTKNKNVRNAGAHLASASQQLNSLRLIEAVSTGIYL